MNDDPEYFKTHKVMFLPLDGTPVRMVDYPSQAEIDLRKLVFEDTYKAKIGKPSDKKRDKGGSDD
jgi:hypothetical protein